MTVSYCRRFAFVSAVGATVAVLLLYADSVIFAAPPADHLSTDLERLPPDLPLPASPANLSPWLRETVVLQPYGHSEFTAITEADTRASRLKKEFGFNTIVVQPPDSHNTIATSADKLTEKQFRAGLTAYRAAGYHIMLYTSVMALGLSPEFQSGAIAREHPDWSQRDSKGNPVLVWGVPWLCPNSGARELALDRCLRIVHEYNADGVLLDNNEFFFAEGGWTCHCDACQKAFREYAQSRFGVDKSKQFFGVAPQQIKIPTEEGPLYSLWLEWRNRVWAEINESFRARLRAADPNIVLFANTQYGYENGMLGTDAQYEREDIVVSESCNLTSLQMSEKMVLGHAIAAGRPLWNYIGTFAKADDYTGLRSAQVVGPAIAATLAHNARPWIVDGFDDGPTDAKSRQLMSALLSWQAAHPQFYNNTTCAVVGVLISPTSRNIRHTPLIPPSVSAVQSTGVPVTALRDDELTPDQLQPLRVLIVESAACLRDESARAIATWVRAGGTLIAALDTGASDELGRKRQQSPLWKSLDLGAAPEHQTNVGSGSVIAPGTSDLMSTVARLTQQFTYLVTPNSGTEVVAYRRANELLLHIIRHQSTDQPVIVQLPALFTPSASRATLFTPGSNDSQPLALETSPNGPRLTIVNAPIYSVVEIAVR